MVAVAPGAAASSDSPSGDGSLESLFDGRGNAGGQPASAGRARPGASEARSTTIDLSAAADPAPGRRGVVSLRHIVGARPSSGRWMARVRRSARIGGWLVGAITVSAGLVALWVLLFTTVSGGDVWLGRPLTPTRHENATQRNAVPGSPGAGSLAPSSVPPKPSASAASTAPGKAAAPSSTSGKGHGVSGTSGTVGTGSGTSGRNGADDPPIDDHTGSRAAAPTTGATSGSGSGTSGGSGSSGSSGSSGGSGGSGRGSSSVSGGTGGHGADG